MKYQIRQSANGKFYNLIQIDADNNEKLIADDTDLNQLKKHPKAEGAEVIKEADIRGTVETK